MISRVSIEDYFKQRDSAPLLDVRAPMEFSKGHIPGAHNLPLFSDEERAIIGTLYKQEGRETAILTGFDFVGNKWRKFIETAVELAPDKRVFVHCWRGGMRSGAMAWALDFYGFEVSVLEGGYKAFRHWILDAFEQDYKLWILGGMTGSHKTEILHEIGLCGRQIIDLEGLAHHQGSAFGSMNKWTQPTQEQFENELGNILRGMHLQEAIWVEDESRTIGKVAIPNVFWKQMQTKSLIEIHIGREERLNFLTQEYGSLNKDFLIEKTEQIRKRLGFDRAALAIQAIKEDNMREFVSIVLDYYDKAYQGCISRRHPDTIHALQFEYATPRESAQIVMKFVQYITY